MKTEKNEKTAKTEKIINPGKLIVISGPSGSGKSTILKELLKSTDYKYSVSVTTREPRSGEIDGVDYYFLSKEEFLKKASSGEMLEYIEYSGYYYGTPRGPAEKMKEAGYNVIFEIDVVGALKIKEKYPETVMIFLVPPSYAEGEKRLRSRGTETEDSINKRLESSKRELGFIYKYDYLVLNEPDLPETAAFNINCIIRAEKHKLNREKAAGFLKVYY